MRESDIHADQDRSKIQAMFDGDPPYNPATLRSMGQAYRANLNFGEAAADLENALAAYTDLVTGVEKLVEVKTSFGDESERGVWGGIIGEEFHKILLEWDQFHFNFQLLSHYFVSQGLGVTFFENDKDWRWRVCGIGEFLLPRGTPATEERVDFAVAKRSYLAHELYSYISNPKAAKEAGWNVEEVRKALAESNRGQRPTDQTWEELEVEFKNNDLYYSYARAKKSGSTTIMPGSLTAPSATTSGCATGPTRISFTKRSAASRTRLKPSRFLPSVLAMARTTPSGVWGTRFSRISR